MSLIIGFALITLLFLYKYYSDKSVNLGNPSTTIIDSPTSSFELCLLIEKIKPQFVISTINEKQASQGGAFKAILEVCKKHEIRSKRRSLLIYDPKENTI